MSKKDKIQITRTDDYAEMDGELTRAMEALDATNLRIEALLEDQLRPVAQETGDTGETAEGATQTQQQEEQQEN
ncbi:MAG TPA: hypothetical protein PLZ53_04395 [Candidatus Hydrogenedentes bacterium]|jgi:hypothetical protein|nr:MAG: hypothetical protein BWY07_01935 [Candidatus Hydrogenedentes bacterium ADurb.Bin170]HNZ49418.1 hypothetical protein [Candidatus Hydrogenedentota bacterium]HOD96573.1 hypothetical protein [Candidatus Hydrogenedentota bacterium]HOH42332.1 hypothetical protein [Candidatus Hydrogenedentota bacterium]HOM48950.1 hypothetical protein [Candidatus Hydrogenedentota bacterium]